MPRHIRMPGALYSINEEIANAITHGVGAVLGCAGTVLMIVFSALQGDPWKVVSSSIYGASLIVLFTMSCLYHALTPKTAKKVFRVFDHCTIFFLIAGTYTPFTLVSIRGWKGWTLFGVVWGAAIVGIVLNSISIERFKIFSMIAYVATGWCIVMAFMPMCQALGLWGMILLALGGISYTAGLIFYKKKEIPYMHTIWHVFVLIGAILHWFAIFFYVIL